MHLPAARFWKLALKGEMEVYCSSEPARGSLIKLSPGSWNVISSFVIQARIICLHFACDGLLDNNSLGPDDAGTLLMVEGSQGLQTRRKKNLWPVAPWNWKSPWQCLCYQFASQALSVPVTTLCVDDVMLGPLYIIASIMLLSLCLFLLSFTSKYYSTVNILPFYLSKLIYFDF